MEIISLKFAFFTIVSVFVYYLLNNKFRKWFLTLLSCGFIASYSYYLVLYVLIYAMVNYFLGIMIQNSTFKKALFRTGIVLNLAQLILLKYASFAIDPVFHILINNYSLAKISEIIIPVGVSYFTLQGIGYLINIKMGWEKAEKNFLNFLLYLVFFPKFLSGPIERSNHFLPQIRTSQPFNEQKVTEGLRIALFGFFKKVAIANQLAPLISSAYVNTDSAYGFAPWIVMLLQPLYLYFDFSGYTDIALGFARAFGFDLLPNFNRPFLSENMTNFWKRFHISLSSWFNDYIFRQTSFKYRRLGVYASVFAVLVTWTLFGIWHGAGWNFMMLGLVQAIAVIYEFFTKKWRMVLFSKVPEALRIWLARVFTYLFYGGSLVFFFSPDLGTAWKFFNKLRHFNMSSHLSTEDNRSFVTAFSLIIVLFTFEIISNDKPELFKLAKTWWNNDHIRFKIFRYIIYYVAVMAIFYFGRMQADFIYFQF
jgi:alginate O-acetyltransferase complex protein AlgI